MSKIELTKDPNTDAFRMEDGKVVGARVDILKAEDSWPGCPAPDNWPGETQSTASWMSHSITKSRRPGTLASW